jgi:hypothetical protein
MANTKVAIINASTVLNDAAVQAVIPALQEQVSSHFAPRWGVDADLAFFPAAAQPPAGNWWLTILDDSDQAGALGYHDVTPEGLPLGKVFANTDLLYNLQWTVTASHELLEMLADPGINLTAFVQTTFALDQNVVGRAYAYEVCDPCEADDDGYVIGGVHVSDFVFPAWFEPFQPPTAEFDYRHLITAPFQLRPGGYMSVFDLTSGTGWQQLYAPGAQRYAARPSVGSRRERRRTARNAWQSTDLLRNRR